MSYYLKHLSKEVSQSSYSVLNSPHIVIILVLSDQMENGCNSRRVIKITKIAYAIQWHPIYLPEEEHILASLGN